MSRAHSALNFNVTPLNLARRDEEAFLFASWTRSFQEYSPDVPDGAYYPYQRKNIDDILDDGAIVLAARDADTPSRLYGYVVAQRLSNAVIVHWTYTKGAYRRLGVANALLAEALKELGNGAERLIYTHRTRWDAKAEALGMEYVPLTRVLPKKSQEVSA